MKKYCLLLLILWAGMSLCAQEIESRTIVVNGVTFHMKKVEGGSFNMGGTAEQDQHLMEDDEWPIHVVTLDDYYIAETEVTQELWQAVMNDNPSSFTGDLQRPVERVMWAECQTFVSQLSDLTGIDFRLPTEAEWEFAARGGKYTHYYPYSGSDDINAVAWWGGNSDNTTHPVAQLQPNELSLYDMSGNVDEWCSDWWGSYDMYPAENPQGPTDGENRVRRGGNWEGSRKGPRVSYRNYELVNIRWNYIGLRLAATTIPDFYSTTSLSPARMTNTETDGRYNIIGQPVGDDYKGIVIEKNEKKLIP